MKRIALLTLLILAQSIAQSAGSAKIMHKKKSNVGWEARVTIRIQTEIPINNWVACDYYDENSQIIASTNHLLNQRVPTWTVKADYNEIQFAICYKNN